VIPLVTQLDAFKQKRALARQFIIAGMAVEITKDGKLTWEDGTTIALGSISYYLTTGPAVRWLSSKGLFTASSRALGWASAIYFGGQAISAWIDPDKGAENFADYVWTPEKYWDRYMWSMETIWNETQNKFDENAGRVQTSTQGVGQSTWSSSQNDWLVGPDFVALGHYQSQLSPYVYDAIMDPKRGFTWFEEVGVSIPPWELETAQHLAWSTGQTV